MTTPSACIETVEMKGHLIDSLLLPKVLDQIITHGGSYVLRDIRIGHKQEDQSFVRIEIRADTAAQLEEILDIIHDHGAMAVEEADCQIVTADLAGCFPESFYSTTNFRTQVRLQGEWIDVEDQEMDCGILLDSEGIAARCVPMTSVKVGDRVVVGRQGLRVFPADTSARTGLFEFMTSAVSSEKPKAVSVREIATAMKKTREAGEKIIAVLGPAVVHTGGGELIGKLIRAGFIQVIFAGNALAAHDLEQSIYGTSLGVSLEQGLPTHEGHEHHLRTINLMRRLGGIKNAVAKGVIISGIMFECVKHDVPCVLGGSVRDDGPLLEVLTDVIVAQAEMRKHIPGAGFCLMVATMLHSIATGNLLPAWVKVGCVDINPATVTKLMDRGSTQTVGIVSDAEPFLRELVAALGLS